jgi:hypothetical protein
VHHESIFVSVQRDAAVSSLYFISLQDLYTCFGCSLHLSSGVLKTAQAATGTSHELYLPVVAHTVLSTHDDGCKEHPKYIERACSEIK